MHLTERTLHLCVDMQRLFSDEGPWPTPWLPHVLPIIEEIAGRFPERTIFSRFITPPRPESMPGAWKNYYRRWPQTTQERINPALLELLPSLARLAPPAIIIDKTRYSAFVGSRLLEILSERRTDGLVITGSETDVCVLSTVLSAVDLGYPVTLVTDAVCSSSNEGHDALLQVYRSRYSEQIDTASAEDVLRIWR
ncbi:MAG: cysteine hydrolase family protein [Sphingomicrobium sp.]